MGPKARRQCAFDFVHRGASRRQRRIRDRAALVGARDVYTWVVGTTTDDSKRGASLVWRCGDGGVEVMQPPSRLLHRENRVRVAKFAGVLWHHVECERIFRPVRFFLTTVSDLDADTARRPRANASDATW